MTASTRVAAWATIIEGSDPTGTVAAESGSLRMHLVYRCVSFDGQIAEPTFTIGTQTYSYYITEYIAVDTFNDLQIEAFIWNEAAIAARSGSTVSFDDSVIAGSQSWSHATFQNVPQVAPASDGQSNTSTQTLNCTTTSTTNDQIVVLGMDHASARAPLTFDTLTERVNSGTGFACGIADGVGGDGTTTVSNDGVANNEMAALAIVFAGTAGGMLAKMLNHG